MKSKVACNLVTIVEAHEVTNLDEYNARDRDSDGVVDGRSTTIHFLLILTLTDSSMA